MRNFLYFYVKRPLHRLFMAFIWRLPRKVVYWCAIRLMVAATTGPYSNQVVPELTAMDALKRWDENARK